MGAPDLKYLLNAVIIYMNKAKEMVKLRKKAFKLWSLRVRELGVCDLCGKKYKEINEKGKPTILQAHHIIGRENKRLAWDVKNGVCLCSYCHKWSRAGAHRGSIIFTDWFMKKHPDRYDYLIENCNVEVEPTIEYMQKQIENLTSHLG
jgi:hypothetical protein